MLSLHVQVFTTELERQIQGENCVNLPRVINKISLSLTSVYYYLR